MQKNEYQCAMCKGIFEKGWSNEEAKAEAREFFGKPPKEWNDTPLVICDDCFQKVHPKDNPEAVERAKKVI